LLGLLIAVIFSIITFFYIRFRRTKSQQPDGNNNDIELVSNSHQASILSGSHVSDAFVRPFAESKQTAYNMDDLRSNNDVNSHPRMETANVQRKKGLGLLKQKFDDFE
jgi:hypothetical protein